MREADTLHTPAGSRIAAVAVQSHLLNNRCDLGAWRVDKRAHDGRTVPSHVQSTLSPAQLGAQQSSALTMCLACTLRRQKELEALLADKHGGLNGLDSQVGASARPHGNARWLAREPIRRALTQA